MIVEEGLKGVLAFLLRNAEIDAQIGLFTDILTETDTTVFSDLTEATFPGYARINTRDVIWPDPAINGDAEAETDGPTMTWEATSDPGSPEDVTGIFVTIKDDEAVECLFLVYSFPDPITIAADGDQVQKKINWFCDNY